MTTPTMKCEVDANASPVAAVITQIDVLKVLNRPIYRRRNWGVVSALREVMAAEQIHIPRGW